MTSIKHQRSTDPKLNEEGMASILVTLIMSVVITLVVIGFAQVATREQSNALQNQLSTTAFYAAETGVNDAINIIQQTLKTNPTYAASDYAKNICGAPTSDSATTDGGIYWPLYNTDTYSSDASTSGATYSCLLVNPSPSEIVTTVGPNSQVIPINTGSAILTLNLTWQSTEQWNSGTCNSSADPQFTTPTTWKCNLSALRIDLLTVPTGTITENSLQSDTDAAFIMPFTTSSSCTGNITLGGSCDNVYGASCSASQGCHVNIALTDSSPSTIYYIRINTLYGSSATLGVSAYDTSNLSSVPPPQPLPLNNAEYIIDSTGLTHGVSKRIQVAVPILQSTNIPGYAIQTTDDLCKRFYIIPPTAYGSSGEGTPHSAVSDFGLSPGDDCSLGY